MKNIRHFGIVVTDIEKSLEFYRDMLGFKIKIDVLEEGKFIDAILGLKDVKVRTVKMVADDGNLIELLWYQSHARAAAKGEEEDLSSLTKGKKMESKEIFNIGASHPAFTVENIDEEYKRLKEKGIKFISLPQVSPNGKAKVAFCYDPDGVPVELVEEIS